MDVDVMKLAVVRGFAKRHKEENGENPLSNLLTDLCDDVDKLRAEVERLTRERDEQRHRGDCNLRSLATSEQRLAHANGLLRQLREQAQDYKTEWVTETIRNSGYFWADIGEGE